MEQELPFRLALLASFVLLLPVAAYHRVKAHATGETLDRRQEGLFIMVAVRCSGIAGMLAFILYVLNPAWMAWSSVPLPVWLRWIGVVLCFAWGFLLVWTFRSLGKNLTDTVVTRKDHTLVTAGPYRWIRHPLYVVVAMSTIANSLAMANWFILLMGTACFALLAIRTRTEERFLLARFGEDYASYMRNTGRFFPRMG